MVSHGNDCFGSTKSGFEATVFCSELFPKIAEARLDNPYSVQTVTFARGEQHRAGACTPFAAIADFQIEFSVVPQIPNSLSRSLFPLRTAAVSRPSRKQRCPTAVFGSGETV
jgi:hypothetical protein